MKAEDVRDALSEENWRARDGLDYLYEELTKARRRIRRANTMKRTIKALHAKIQVLVWRQSCVSNQCQ